MDYVSVAWPVLGGIKDGRVRWGGTEGKLSLKDRAGLIVLEYQRGVVLIRKDTFRFQVSGPRALELGKVQVHILLCIDY